ncbi:AP-3 complex subunit mu-1 (AP-3 adaptor complex mu3A subunit) (Adaptor-related protein complex 3 subunit mu-1) (Mu-adaptin 3A) (Mu3A-adaptin) [Durusdinium trenchii]|uniref:AP-3 complex subunit mu-1 (AP-3 adaptor complex mu3A subunit) (Adaptor-related protein complex 3 subunit mu-1) (Mu-adaptin 3A) (Mu3A-adaptin) n=1 Tax=Durusdinium trenchii TaxID=1381693 RepID=A0ABP0JYG9_9DINO
MPGNTHSEVLIEKHWRKVTNRTFVDLFLEEVSKCELPQDVLPVLSMSNLNMINVFRDKLFLLCTVAEEVQPLLVVEFLHRVLDTFADYFSNVDEVVIKENFSMVYQLLEEMCDNGIPFITESNALREMVVPPSISNRIAAVVSGKSNVAEELPDGTVSNIPWRRKGVHYNVNAIYLDIEEEIDCIMGPSGELVSCQVHGSLLCTSKLSGMPDLVVSFDDSRIMQDFFLHPCVRVSKFEKDRVLSFVPPDGKCSLIKYKVDPNVYSTKSAHRGASTRNFGSLPIPVYCRPQITYSDRVGHVEVVVGEKHVPGSFTNGTPNPSSSSSKSAVDEISVVIPFPRTVRSTDLKCTFGTVLSDETTKECRWTIGKLPRDGSTPKLSGTFTCLPESPPFEDALTVSMNFKLIDASVSKLTISEVSLYGETYQPYKYVRSVLRAGNFQIRT